MRICLIKKLRFSICTIFAFFLLLSVMAGSADSEVANMPGILVIKHIQNEYGPVTFDHTMHVSMAGNCGECHHTHNEKINSTCMECHSLNSKAFKASAKHGFLPCSGCHTDYSPEAPGMPGLKVALHKKCFGCHVGIGELGASPQGCVRTCHVR